MKSVSFLILLTTQILLSKSIASNDLIFPNENQREEIAKQLLQGIEKIDAITIELRNKTRRVDWIAYKELIKQNVVNSSNWDALYRSLDNLHYGILNRHSYVKVEEAISRQVKTHESWPSIELGYTWPEVTFFSITNGKSIKSINNRKVEDIFDEFFNLYCNDVHQSGCLRLFSENMKFGYYFLGRASELEVKYANDSIDKITKQKKPHHKNHEPNDCHSLYPSFNINLVYNGNQSCLFSMKNTYVLKILYFGKWGTSYDDIYCETPDDKGMCSDIHEIKRITNASVSKPLIIDLQDNRGGSENTPWIAALTKETFKDNLIRYKNIDLLTDVKIRNSAFYYNERAENWYQKVKEEIGQNDHFLPLRTDFCQGSTTCDVRDVNSAAKPINYSDLKLIINEKCVSSCDDLVWRLRDYAQAKTYGQLSATDGAFARLNGYVFIMKDGTVKNIISGEDYEPENSHGTLIVSYRIPISKTVNAKGKNLEGDDAILDFPLPITQENFQEISEDNLRRVLSL